MARRRAKVKWFEVKGCMGCPNIRVERTPGAGYAVDYYCRPLGKEVCGYVEWPSEERKDGDFPEWCPL